jgi:hypothetical protein
MKKTARKVKARKHSAAGRAVAKTPATATLLSVEMRKQIDTWARLQRDQPDRTEAIRRLLVAGLKAERSKRPLTEKAAAKASELAGNTLDKLADTSATAEEREQRKRRLLKGPKELR